MDFRTRGTQVPTIEDSDSTAALIILSQPVFGVEGKTHSKESLFNSN